MKKLLLLSLILITFQFKAAAQIGINGGYVSFDAPEYSKLIDAREELTSNSTNFKQSTFQIGVDYWFRLPKKRIEFYPEISYSQAKAFVALVPGFDFGYENLLELKTIQINFNTHIYPFDFAGDCDCPTFSKDGDILKKGFFIRLAPGISGQRFTDNLSTVSIVGQSNSKTQANDFGFNLRAGIGLDIGVSDFFTITPIAQYTYTFPTGAFNYFIDPALSLSAQNSTSSQLFVGLRLGFRFDEMNKYGYR